MTKLPPAVRPYAGPNPRIDDPWTRISYETSRDVTAAFYAKSTDADVAMTREQVVLCEATAAFLYSAYTPARMRAKAGDYPKVARIVAELLDGERTASDRRKVLKMLLWCRDIHARGRATKEAFAGGHEERVAFGGTDTCNEMNRVFMVMCQLAGFASRYVGHFAVFRPGCELEFLPGHGVAEVFVEGGWAYFDIRGRHFVWPDGRLASHWDLVRNPELYVNQPDAVQSLLDPRYHDWNNGQRLVMWPSLQVIANYDAVTRARMTCTPVRQTAAAKRRFAAFSRARKDASRAQLHELLKSGYALPARSPWK